MIFSFLFSIFVTACRTFWYVIVHTAVVTVCVTTFNINESLHSLQPHYVSRDNRNKNIEYFQKCH